MSYDLKLATVCDHRIFRQYVSLDSDRVTISIPNPLSSIDLSLYASDEVVPKSYYDIIYDPDQNVMPMNRKIIFKKPWKSVEDYFEVDYVTIKTYCPKCATLEQIDDISYDAMGNAQLLRTENLLVQNLEKFTITELFSNPFQTFVGTGLAKLVGERVANTTYLTTRITQEINTTLNTFKDLQRQYTSAGRILTTGESLDQVLSVKVLFDINDPSILRVDVTVRAKSGKTVGYSQFLKVA